MDHGLLLGRPVASTTGNTSFAVNRFLVAKAGSLSANGLPWAALDKGLTAFNQSAKNPLAWQETCTHNRPVPLVLFGSRRTLLQNNKKMKKPIGQALQPPPAGHRGSPWPSRIRTNRGRHQLPAPSARHHEAARKRRSPRISSSGIGARRISHCGSHCHKSGACHAGCVTPAFLAPNKASNKSRVISKLSSWAHLPPFETLVTASLPHPWRACRESRRHRPHSSQHPRVPPQRRGRPPCRESRARRGPAGLSASPPSRKSRRRPETGKPHKNPFLSPF
jgi:hypothetical protein